MQAVIMAGGLGKRLRPITDHTPKPLVPVLGKPILRHIVEALPEEISEILVVVSPDNAQVIEDYLKSENLALSIDYIIQPTPAGTADALWRCQDRLRGKFLVMSGDDILGAEALAEAVKMDACILVAESEYPERFGVVELGGDGKVKNILEKPDNPPTNLVSTGVFVLPLEIFNFWPEISKNDEYYLPDAITAFIKSHSLSVVTQKLWLPIGYPKDIALAEEALRELNK